uniref:Uncharacterized protein n=1 Tax=Siphoviridae sp. ctCfI1 TaxID=2827809 RepID=A0A8S5SRE4_9CAUD|nr:MAG TPA: hypothetical protein [Siphoviridae sp. ctCfI1]
MKSNEIVSILKSLVENLAKWVQFTALRLQSTAFR